MLPQKPKRKEITSSGSLRETKEPRRSAWTEDGKRNDETKEHPSIHHFVYYQTTTTTQTIFKPIAPTSAVSSMNQDDAIDLLASHRRIETETVDNKCSCVIL